MFVHLESVLLLANVKDLESFLGGLDTAQNHGAESRAYNHQAMFKTGTASFTYPYGSHRQTRRVPFLQQ